MPGFLDTLRRLRKGDRLLKALLYDADVPEGSAEEKLLRWLRDSPNRMKQKSMFAFFMMKTGMPEGLCGERIMASMAECWKTDSKAFGKVLVTEIERGMTWDDPKGDTEKIVAQVKAKQMVEDFKRDLIALDPAN